MANVKLIFNGTNGTDKHELQCFINQDDEIYIEINIEPGSPETPSWICLDKSTAIKFAKTLRTEINKIEL